MGDSLEISVDDKATASEEVDSYMGGVEERQLIQDW